jgi:hypothetical protein
MHHLIGVICSVVAVAAAIGMTISFWPGPIGHDYHVTLEEAASWRFSGHQPPSAAIATWLLTFGSANPTAMFVLKVVTYFGALVVFVTSRRVPSLIKVLATVMILSPTFFYLAPILRNNTLQLVFLGMAFAIGLSGKTAWHTFLASANLIIAVMFSPAPHLGHLAIIVLYMLWRYPHWGLPRVAGGSILGAAALWVPTITIKYAITNVDRSSTLYVSALNGIGGLYRPGEQTCLGTNILRGGAASPEEVYRDHYEHPKIYLPLWTEKKGFKLPNDVSPEVRAEVISCWWSTIRAKPLDFAMERARLAVLGMRTSALEPPFVWMHRTGAYELNPNFRNSANDPSLNAFAKGAAVYGQLGNTLKLGNIITYLVIFLTTAVIVAVASRRRRLFVLASAGAILGFMMPQLLFAQDTMFRYYVEAAYVASWLSLVNIWLLVMGDERVEPVPNGTP